MAKFIQHVKSKFLLWLNLVCYNLSWIFTTWKEDHTLCPWGETMRCVFVLSGTGLPVEFHGGWGWAGIYFLAAIVLRGRADWTIMTLEGDLVEVPPWQKFQPKLSWSNSKSSKEKTCCLFLFFNNPPIKSPSPSSLHRNLREQATLRSSLLNISWEKNLKTTGSAGWGEEV